MTEYESPTITELGSVADMTRGDSVALDFDGVIFHRDQSGGVGGS